MTLNLDGAEQRALYKLEGDILSLYYRKGENDFPNSFPSALNYFDSGTLLILQPWEHADVVFEYSDLTREEATLIAKHPGNVSLPTLSVLTPETAAALATRTGNLSLPAITELTREVARALATHKGTWLVMRGLKSITPEIAAELAKGEGVLDLGIQELSPETAAALGSGSLSLDSLNSITPKAAMLSWARVGCHCAG